MTFSIDLGDLQAEAAKLAAFNGTALADELAPALNAVADEVYATARERMIAGINLTDAYVQDHMQVSYASAAKGLVAEITAPGGRDDQTPLGRYFASQLMVADPRAKGDASRGIPAGMKQAGVAVEVARGAARPVAGNKAFVMPLLNNNGLGVFVRTKYGLKRHLYAPAPYQLFRVAAAELDDSAGDTLEQRLASVAERALQDAVS